MDSADIKISKKKPSFPINKELEDYLGRHRRRMSIPIKYIDLLSTHERIPLLDESGEDTLWQIMLYPTSDMSYINNALTMIYALLKTDGEFSITKHLYIERIDYCTFGNSKPFRIKIVNQFNDNYDYFYIKTADSSRVYGLELEDILSPNRLNFIVDELTETLVEEHIIGIPGDMFITNYLNMPTINKVRVAKEFIKFNERCFIRLLGDMRSYNYVIDITPDFDNEQYRVRAIDFDQQCYEGKHKVYLPQFFKENAPIVEFCNEVIRPETMRQYQLEERVLMAKRYRGASSQLNDLLECIVQDDVTTTAKMNQLKEELNEYHDTSQFKQCSKMGEVLDLHMNLLLRP